MLPFTVKKGKKGEMGENALKNPRRIPRRRISHRHRRLHPLLHPLLLRHPPPRHHNQPLHRPRVLHLRHSSRRHRALLRRAGVRDVVLARVLVQALMW